MSKNNKKIQELLDRGTERIYPSRAAMEKALQSGSRLRVYFGVDPTSPHLHLDHSTSLLILKRFQKLGHEVVFLVGDFTARIGDPTGKISARRQLSPSEISRNAKNYKQQASKILEFNSASNPARLVFNSEWWSGTKLEHFIDILSKNTVGRILARDMFKKRISQKKEIFLHEFVYPLLQGYDSVALKADVEVGGSDQTFNMLAGRALSKIYLNKEKFVIAKKILEDPLTKKILMSKSEGRYIALSDSPEDMYGKIMALPDGIIFECFTHWTEMPISDIKKIQRDAGKKKLQAINIKERLALEVVAIHHGSVAARRARDYFSSVFRRKEQPIKMPGIKIKNGPVPAVELLIKTRLAGSRSEARRLIHQRGVSFDGRQLLDWSEMLTVKKGKVLRVGKRRFVKII